jgi:hypothetical protein
MVKFEFPSPTYTVSVMGGATIGVFTTGELAAGSPDLEQAEISSVIANIKLKFIRIRELMMQIFDKPIIQFVGKAWILT